MSKQNIYDNPKFFSGYNDLRKNNGGFNSVLEQPALHSLLPSMQGKVVCDLGCGFGDFCNYAVISGANEVIGVDISHKMLEVAKAKSTNKKIVYVNKAIEDFNYKNSYFDVIVSSLAFHYIQDIASVFDKINSLLKQSGELVFSVEHPMCTSNPAAETVALHNEMYWLIKNYKDEVQFKQNWFVDGVLKYHRKLSTYINLLVDAGFSIEKVLEPMADHNTIAKNKAFKVHQLRPPLLLITAKKVRKM